MAAAGNGSSGESSWRQAPVGQVLALRIDVLARPLGNGWVASRDVMSVIFTVFWSAGSADHAVSMEGAATAFGSGGRAGADQAAPFQREILRLGLRIFPFVILRGLVTGNRCQ